MKFHTVAILVLLVLSCAINHARAIAQESKKQTFRITVLNTEGSPQVGMILKITGYSGEYVSNGQGLFEFEREINKKSIRTANFYFPSDRQKPVKSLRLDESVADTIIRIDSPEDMVRYKQNGRSFFVEGIVRNNGIPVAKAEVTIQGTGRRAFTDKNGRFVIEADYNHDIMIRADKMENKYMDVDPFLMNPDRPYTIDMIRKASDRIYSSAEQMPEYPGGMKAFFNYVRRKAHTTELAEQTLTEGTVIVRFVVEKDGSITSPHIVRGLHALLDTAAMNAIVVMRDWIPAKDHGVTVRCKYSVPIPFKRPKPKVPEPEPVAALHNDSLLIDSIIVCDSLLNDSLRNDSLLNDSVIMHVLPVPQSDSLQADSLVGKDLMPANGPVRMDSLSAQKADTIEADSLGQSLQPSAAEVKPKKRNAFVRFFRRLFGIKDKKEEARDALPVPEEFERKGIPDAETENGTENEQQNNME